MLSDNITMKQVNSSIKNVGTENRLKAPHVLAVDDAPDNLLLIEAILDDDEYRLTCAQDGPGALEQVNQTPPDVILLDVSMPGMSGLEVTQRIRQDNSLPYIPILLVTANDQDICRKGLEAGADGYIRKPFNIRELEAKVRSLLQLNRFMGRHKLYKEANA